MPALRPCWPIRLESSRLSSRSVSTIMPVLAVYPDTPYIRLPSCLPPMQSNLTYLKL